MRTARVVLQAPVCSFRHPFFVTGVQPTFDMPPPSTVHGLCASALGSWPEPRAFFFGLHFQYRARGKDLEHQHITYPHQSRDPIASAQGPLKVTTGVTVQPVEKAFLFDATLTLYLDPSLGTAFLHPAFPLTLGRSQDLAEVLSVEEIELQRPQKARLEHTLLPRSVRPCVRFGSTVLLSRHLALPPERDPDFAQYIVLHEPVFFGAPSDEPRAFTPVEGIATDSLWSDPSYCDDDGYARGLWLHRLAD